MITLVFVVTYTHSVTIHVVKRRMAPRGVETERNAAAMMAFAVLGARFFYECLIVYLPFCSWEMYSFDLVPSSRLNQTSSLLTVVMMALHDTQTHREVRVKSTPSHRPRGPVWECGVAECRHG